MAAEERVEASGPIPPLLPPPPPLLPEPPLPLPLPLPLLPPLLPPLPPLTATATTAGRSGFALAYGSLSRKLHRQS